MAQERGDGKVQALHPTLLDDEKMSPYLDELSFALSDPEVTNIAISGPYGAGKSTVVDTWEHRELEKAKGAKKTRSWVHISLAEFAGEHGSKAPTEGKGGQETPHGIYRDVESELINQLIQVEAGKRTEEPLRHHGRFCASQRCRKGSFRCDRRWTYCRPPPWLGQ